MRKEELQALGLTDEQVAKIVEDYGKNYVSKTRFNEVNEECKALKEQAQTTAGEIDKLKKENGDNGALKEQIEALQAQIKTAEKENAAKIQSLRVDNAVEKALMGAKARNTKAVRALLNLDGAEFDGEEVKGLTEQIEELRESQGYLFEETQSLNGYRPQESGDVAGESTAEAFKAALGGGI